MLRGLFAGDGLGPLVPLEKRISKSIQSCSERSPLSCDETFPSFSVTMAALRGVAEWFGDYGNYVNHILRPG